MAVEPIGIYDNLNVPRICAQPNAKLANGVTRCKIDPAGGDTSDNLVYYCELSEAMDHGGRVVSRGFGTCFPILMHKTVEGTMKGGFVHMVIEDDDDVKWKTRLSAVLQAIGAEGLTINIYSRLIKTHDSAMINTKSAVQIANINKVADWFKNKGYDSVKVFYASSRDEETDECEINLINPDYIIWRQADTPEFYCNSKHSRS